MDCKLDFGFQSEHGKRTKSSYNIGDEKESENDLKLAPETFILQTDGTSFPGILGNLPMSVFDGLERGGWG